MDIPEKVWAIGVARDETIAHAPILVGDIGFSPLSVQDGEGERALPVFTTLGKAEMGILHFTTEEERENVLLSTVLVGMEDLLRTFRLSPAGAPKVDYIGVDMGEGDRYAVLRP